MDFQSQIIVHDFREVKAVTPGTTSTVKSRERINMTLVSLCNAQLAFFTVER